MDASEWPDLIEKFLFSRDYRAGTREQYRLSARTYVDWCLGRGIDPVKPREVV